MTRLHSSSFTTVILPTGQTSIEAHLLMNVDGELFNLDVSQFVGGFDADMGAARTFDMLSTIATELLLADEICGACERAGIKIVQV